MAEVPEDFHLGPEETLEPETLILPGPLELPKDAETDAVAETDAEPPAEIDQEPPPPETQGEDLEEEEPESSQSGQPQSAGTPEEDTAADAGTDLSGETEQRIPQEVKSETSGETDKEIFKDLEVPGDEQREETYLEPSEEAKSDVTEVHTETEEDSELSSEVPAATISGKIFELLNVPEESLSEQHAETDVEPPEQIREDSPSDASVTGDEETLEIAQMAGAEIPEETQEFPDDKLRQSMEDKAAEPAEEITSEFAEERSREPSPTLSEQTGSEVPEDTGEESEEGMEKQSSEDTGLMPPEESRPEVQEETRRKSVEEVLELTKDNKPEDQIKKQGESTEELELLQQAETEETLGESAEEKELELPEQVQPEFPKEELLQKPTEGTGQVPPQETKPETQEKTATMPTERSLELPEETQQKETLAELAKEDRPEPIKSVDQEELQRSESLRIDLALEPDRGSEVISVSTDYEYYSELQSMLPPVQSHYCNVCIVESQPELTDLTKKTTDSSQELQEPGPKDKGIQPKKRSVPQFDYLKWSPERVAEWISELGFPQYKECFTANFISGQKLIHVNCSNLPQMGITDFEDMKAISRHTRELLQIEEPLFRRSIRFPYRDNTGLFLQQKAHSGAKSDALTLSEFVKAARLQDYAPQITALEENGAP
ncbi:sterile alpha motif domain-containing protein 15 [Ochotona princeps]|uniref:sterile alpha motif domain-containing protein 15 n=1 Tax=Ochotona princeps TaxID=9978 RepID=UPI002715469F|nr:sterile alpha motif domain-containing protein 15 [Ochotona princeps]